MRLRDVPRYWCGVCWFMVSLLSLVWLFFTAITVLALIGNQGGAAAPMGFLSALTGSMVVWAGYTEALSHYRSGE